MKGLTTSYRQRQTAPQGSSERQRVSMKWVGLSAGLLACARTT